MTALLDLVPGSVGLDTARQELGARLASSAVAALPPGLGALGALLLGLGGAAALGALLLRRRR